MLSAMCIEAANYIINRTNKFNDGKNYSDRIFLTCKRLQKLLYFSEIEYMKRHNGEPMFNDQFHAWPSGPVIPSVYDVFVQYQDGTMYPHEEGQHTPLTQDMIEVLDHIFNKTIDIDTYDLVDKSHNRQGPWSAVYIKDDVHHEQIIPKNKMLEFYIDQEIFA